MLTEFVEAPSTMTGVLTYEANENGIEVTSVRVIEGVVVNESSEEKGFILAPISIRQHLQNLQERSSDSADDDESFYQNVLFFSILLCILLALIIFCLVATNWFYEVFGWSRLSRSATSPTVAEFRRKQGVKALAMTKIELWSVDNEHFPNNVSCVICLEDFAQGDLVRKLNCDHVFHVRCVDNWILKSKAACPICKKRVGPPHLSTQTQTETLSSYNIHDADQVELTTVGNETLVTIEINTSPSIIPNRSEAVSNPYHDEPMIEYFLSPKDASADACVVEIIPHNTI